MRHRVDQRLATPLKMRAGEKMQTLVGRADAIEQGERAITAEEFIVPVLDEKHRA